MLCYTESLFHSLGGIALQETQPGSGPFFLGQVNCKGDENSLFNCSIDGDECDSQYSGAAGVLCYKQRSECYQLNTIVTVRCKIFALPYF